VGEEKMIVIDALVAALRARGMEVIEQPQAATNTNAHLELWLTGYTFGGEGKTGNSLNYETMTFRADVVSSGVARQFVSGLRKTLKAMMGLGESSLGVPVFTPVPGDSGAIRETKLKAHFEKTAEGVFEYESESSPMPARFVEKWRITITYPASIVADEEEEES
jgi:hypothetical protein